MTQALTDRQRQCYDLYFGQRLTQAQVADKLNMHQSNVSRAIHIAMAKLDGVGPKTFTVDPAKLDKIDLRRVRGVV